MRIEKINENQIRCTLTKEDLADRQIKISELAYGSEKAKRLFRDMIEKANDEFGFEVNDIPVMVEAIPLAGENIILQITKVEYPEELDTRFSKFSEDYEGDVEEDDFLFSDMQGADDIIGMFQKMKEDLKQQAEEKESNPENIGKAKEKQTAEIRKEKRDVPANLTKMFEAKNLEQLERLAHILGFYYQGENDIYKDEKKNKYYLLVRKSHHSPEEFNKICNIISEYAITKKYSASVEAFLKEHGKLILKGNALQILEEILG